MLFKVSIKIQLINIEKLRILKTVTVLTSSFNVVTHIINTGIGEIYLRNIFLWEKMRWCILNRV